MRLPRYATKFDFARVIQRELADGESVSSLARKYGVARLSIVQLAYGSRQSIACKKLMEALGYNSELPYFTRRNGR